MGGKTTERLVMQGRETVIAMTVCGMISLNVGQPRLLLPLHFGIFSTLGPGPFFRTMETSAFFGFYFWISGVVGIREGNQLMLEKPTRKPAQIWPEMGWFLTKVGLPKLDSLRAARRFPSAGVGAPRSSWQWWKANGPGLSHGGVPANWNQFSVCDFWSITWQWIWHLP